LETKSKILPPTYFLILLLSSVALHFLCPVWKIIPGPYRYLGIIPIVLGMVLNLWADSLFKKKKTTVKPYESPAELVTSGPFRISRHPMYVGMVAMLLGVAIVLGSVIPFVFPVLFVILMETMFIPLEERELEEAFGVNYLDYKRKVRRWI
jgi:protein-S-isoprenylcysteine O-methyltransferase Ste14